MNNNILPQIYNSDPFDNNYLAEHQKHKNYVSNNNFNAYKFSPLLNNDATDNLDVLFGNKEDNTNNNLNIGMLLSPEEYANNNIIFYEDNIIDESKIDDEEKIKREKMSIDYYKAEMERMSIMMDLMEQQKKGLVKEIVDKDDKLIGIDNITFSNEIKEYKRKILKDNELIIEKEKEYAKQKGISEGKKELAERKKELDNKEKEIERIVRNKTCEAEEQLRMAQAKLDHAKMLEGKAERIKQENEYLVSKNGELLEDKDINMEYLCVVCMSDTKNCLLEPCNHLAICISCYNVGNIRTCPCCRENVTGMRKVFI